MTADEVREPGAGTGRQVVPGQASRAPPPGGLHEAWLTPARLLSLIVVLVGAYGAVMIVRALANVLVMLLVALFLSFAMEPAVQFLSRSGWRRGAATGAVFLLAVLVSVGVVAAMTPLVIDQVSGLIRSVPRSVDEVNRVLSQLPFGIDLEASPELRREFASFSADFGDDLRGIALGAASNVVNVGATALGVVVNLLAVGLITFYLVADGPRFRRTLARPLPPDRQREMLAIWELAVAKTGGYIYSRLLIALASAVAHGIFLVVLGIPYPLPLGIWMGITTAFVPIVGVYLGGLLLMVVAATEDPVSALWVLAFVVVYQQVENYVLAPNLQARTMDVHPAVAFTSVLVGATLLGAVGALLALPATAIIQALLSTYVRRNELIAELREVRLPGEPGPAPRRPEKPRLPKREAPA